MDLGWQDRPGEPDCIDEVVDGTCRVVAHEGVGLGYEVLDDDLLHMAESLVRGGDRLKGLNAIGSVLADADENARRERDCELACSVKRRQPPLGGFVRSATMRHEIGAQGFDHHALAR